MPHGDGYGSILLAECCERRGGAGWLAGDGRDRQERAGQPLAHQPEVRRAFPDGVFWITLGQKPQLAEQQRWLARELGDEALFPDERSGKECLRTLLAGRKSLLVLDDVWQRELSSL